MLTWDVLFQAAPLVLIMVLAGVVWFMYREIESLKFIVSKVYSYMDLATVGAMYAKADGSEYALVTGVVISPTEDFDTCEYSVFIETSNNKEGRMVFKCVRDDCTLPLFKFGEIYPSVLMEADDNGNPTDRLLQVSIDQ